MELWIRIQCRYRLIKVDDIIVRDNDLWYESEKGSLLLGNYKDEIRALEVLDEIQKLLEPKFVLHTEEIEKPITEYMYTIEQIKDIKELSIRVYEMPKE